MNKAYLEINQYLSSCHASSVCSMGKNTLVAYFGSNLEGSRKAEIWVSRKSGDRWEEPAKVVTGKEATGLARGCWNPVFFVFKDSIFLYFKVGRTPSDWAGHYVVSRDQGRSWSGPEALGEGFLGPTRSTPILSNGVIISGSCTEVYDWRIHFELSKDGRKWRAAATVPQGDISECIQPALLDLGNGCIKALARSTEGCIVATRSTDNGETWSRLERLSLPNPNSGIASVSIEENRHILAYNPSTSNRTPLVLATSIDGERWTDAITLESGTGEFSYPALCATNSGIIVTYTVNRVDIACVEIEYGELQFSG